MVRNFYLVTCPVTGKLGFETRALAKRSRRESHFHDVSVYMCEHCNLFHVGGWHGVKDREAHREKKLSATITPQLAARTLDVSVDFIGRLIDAGKVRHENGNPYRDDIERLTTQ